MYQAPISAIMLLVFWPFMEDTQSFYAFDFSNREFLVCLFYFYDFFQVFSYFYLFGF